MAIKIDDDSMSVDLDGAVIATATRTGDCWAVTDYPAALTRNQAITALMIAEYLTTGRDENDPFVIALREELPHG
jgi:hypothetical protein